MKGWIDYWRAVGGRISWDRSLLRGAWTVPWLMTTARLRRPGRMGTIAFHPQPAAPWYTMRLALAGTGIRVTSNVADADAVMVFDDRTRSDAVPPRTRGRLINSGISDVSKRRVGEVFERVFGYPLTLDPRAHVGPMVEKADENGVHDGRIVQGPLSVPAPGAIYQHLVDSHVEPGVTEDLRCVCVDGRVVQVFRKRKAVAERFRANYLETTLQAPEARLTAAELSDIARFCRAMGLDFGSIDVLRDHRGDGRIYIVDVNKTCMPVLSMPVAEMDRALARIGRAAEQLVLGSRAPADMAANISGRPAIRLRASRTGSAAARPARPHWSHGTTGRAVAADPPRP
ncbi:MAG: hypothetical protein WBG08_13665 [Litorimonas sp.]